MKNFHQQFIATVAVCLSFAFFVPHSDARQGFPANVNVTEVKETQLSPVAWVTGTVVSRNNSQIAAEVSGRLIMLADLGAHVEKGQVIAKLDPQPLTLQLHEAQANTESAKATAAFQESEVKRKKALVDKKLIAEQSLEETISSYQRAKANLAAEQAKLAQIKQDLAYTELKAPFEGIVAQRLRNQGEFVNNGNAIIRLVETANVEASLFAPLTAYRFLQQSDDLLIKSPLGENRAPIKTIIPVADTRSHLMEVRLDMSAIDWPIGLDIKAAVANGASKQVTAVPRDALVLRRNATSIFIIDAENKAKQIPVTIGISEGQLVEVQGDVRPGQLVVIRGAERLQPGQAVNIKQNNQALVSGSDSAGNR
ncbi:efflux RND transporter periplasmic adaptor subunit [Thalassotalea marina]|uniref:Hemolysin D n=1 Tax=Thalassotalea marina TaxID=1673741 RepID=A0A919BGT2_9GAMM|nr:efflux RND transporter periplasmic adaptor subunit [Thalassotalea marina]GHF87918.1 hemolysin D [Thalassotalea marina]